MWTTVQNKTWFILNKKGGTYFKFKLYLSTKYII